jgi:hypothetical protein
MTSLRWASGPILDGALQELKLERRSIYVTNAVKHFKHEHLANGGFTSIRIVPSWNNAAGGSTGN